MRTEFWCEYSSCCGISCPHVVMNTFCTFPHRHTGTQPATHAWFNILPQSFLRSCAHGDKHNVLWFASEKNVHKLIYLGENYKSDEMHGFSNMPLLRQKHMPAEECELWSAEVTQLYKSLSAYNLLLMRGMYQSNWLQRKCKAKWLTDAEPHLFLKNIQLSWL